MTEQELKDLDAELDNGTMDEEQYCATLRDEVARIHPDYDPCTIENMIRMQLRIEALETVLAEDVIDSDLPDVSEVIEAGAGKEDGAKPGFKEDDKDSQIKALLQKLKEKTEKHAAEQKVGKPNPNGEQGTAEKSGAEQQHAGQQEGDELSGQKPQPDGHEVDGQQNGQDQQPDQKEGSQQPQNGSQSEGTSNGSPNGQMQDQNSEHGDQQQNDQNKQNDKDGQSQQDQSKQDQSQQNQDQQNQQKDNGKSNQKSKVWWTWLIVPDWNEWMKDEWA